MGGGRLSGRFSSSSLYAECVPAAIGEIFATGQCLLRTFLPGGGEADATLVWTLWGGGLTGCARCRGSVLAFGW